MTKKQAIQLFEERKVRTVWDDEQEKWHFSIVDIVAVLTDSADPKQYIKRMKSRDAMLKLNWGTICTLVPMRSEDGKMHKEMSAEQAKEHAETEFEKYRIIQDRLFQSDFDRFMDALPFEENYCCPVNMCKGL